MKLLIAQQEFDGLQAEVFVIELFEYFDHNQLSEGVRRNQILAEWHS